MNRDWPGEPTKKTFKEQQLLCGENRNQIASVHSSFNMSAEYVLCTNQQSTKFLCQCHGLNYLITRNHPLRIRLWNLECCWPQQLVTSGLKKKYSGDFLNVLFCPLKSPLNAQLMVGRQRSKCLSVNLTRILGHLSHEQCMSIKVDNWLILQPPIIDPTNLISPIWTSIIFWILLLNCPDPRIRMRIVRWRTIILNFPT